MMIYISEAEATLIITSTEHMANCACEYDCDCPVDMDAARYNSTLTNLTAKLYEKFKWKKPES